MKLLAVADVHFPRFEKEFREALSQVSPPDLFLFAGDMINRGAAEEYPRVIDTVIKYLGDDFPIIGCYGNEEYTEIRKDICNLVKGRISLLDEKSKIFKIDDRRVGIVGTQGSLDKPTIWQRRNVPHIKDTFARRADRATSLLKRIRKADIRILLMHYSPCIETCEGEDERSFAWLGSRKFYSVIHTIQPELVLHGHVHNATVHEAKIGATLVRNVALPAVGKITELEF